jgi:hypothetical protein
VIGKSNIDRSMRLVIAFLMDQIPIQFSIMIE